MKCDCKDFNYDAGEHPGVCNCRHDDADHLPTPTPEERTASIARLQTKVFEIGTRAMVNPASELSANAVLLVMEVVTAAAWYWVSFDADDFCVQSVSPERIVFGSTNRLIWAPSKGFWPDVSSCNQRFTAHARMLGALPNPSGTIKA